MVGIAGLVGGYTAGATVGQAEKTVNQSIDISTGRINPAEIIKFAFGIILIVCFFLLIINGLRGWFITIDQVACNLRNAGCSLPVVGWECASCSAELMPSFTWAWQAEWYLRCIMVLCFSVISWVLLWIWGKFLAHNLLRADRQIERIKSLVYGTSHSGNIEQEIDQQL